MSTRRRFPLNLTPDEAADLRMAKAQAEAIDFLKTRDRFKVGSTHKYRNSIGIVASQHEQVIPAFLLK